MASGAPAQSQGNGDPRPADHLSSHLPLCPVPFFITPFVPSPIPQPPIWLTAAIQCFWMFLNFTKWASFKILDKIAFSYFLKPSSQAREQQQFLGATLCSLSIWKLNVDHFATWTIVLAENSRLQYCYKWKSAITQLHQSTETLQRQWSICGKSYLLHNPPVKWSASNLVAFEDHQLSHSQ